MKIGVFVFICVIQATLGQWIWEDEDVTPGPPIPTSSTPIVSTPTTTTTQASQTVDNCIKQCPKTTQYNPICGTDRVTYRNQGELTCAQRCGINVQMSFLGACGGRPPVTTSTTPPSRIVTTLPPNYDSCIRRCTVTADFTPICGSDGVTYQNISRLRCVQSCGLNVQMQANGSCSSA